MSHFLFCDLLLETKHVVVPERTKQVCLQRAIRDCDILFINLLMEHVKNKPTHMSRGLLDCVLREDRNEFIRLSKKSRLEDILFSVLYSESALNTSSNEQDVAFLIRATHSHDFKSNKGYVSERYKKIQEKAKYIVDLIYKKNRTIGDEMTISSVFELVGIVPESLLDVKRERETLHIIDEVIIRNMNRVKTLQKEKKEANPGSIEALTKKSEKIIDKIYFLLKIRTGLFSKARKQMMPDLNNLKELISEFLLD